MKIRRAAPDDASAINAVYGPFVHETAITFDIGEMTQAQRREWIAERLSSSRTPVFVAENDAGAVIGFANAAPFDPRGAYETSVKTSIFLAAGAQGEGIGAKLYFALFEALSGADVHRAYALIVAPNPASVALHERLSFRHVATLDEVGRKFGRYHSVMWFEKRLES